MREYMQVKISARIKFFTLAVLLSIWFHILWEQYSFSLAAFIQAFNVDRQMASDMVRKARNFEAIVAAVVFSGIALSSVGILYYKKWAIRLLCSMAVFVFINAQRPLMFFSFDGFVGKSAMAVVLLSIVALWILFRKEDRTEFGFIAAPVSKKRIMLSRIFGYGMLVIIAGIMMWYFLCYFIIYPRNKIVYTSKEEVLLEQGYVRREIANVSLLLPQDMRVGLPLKAALLKHLDNDTVVTMFQPQKGVLMSVGMDLLGNFYKYLGDKNNYDFNKRFNRGLHFLSQIYRHRFKDMVFQDIVIAGRLEGFMTRLSRTNSVTYDFRLYDRNNKNISATILFDIKKNALSVDEIDKIIGSVKLASYPLKSAGEYFNDGLSFIEQKQYETARLCFVNALYQKWQIPEYHYYLGRCFFEDGYPAAAEHHIKIALSLKPDYADARVLLGRIKQ